MNKGRKTTLEERIEIVQYTLAHDLDYERAVKKFGVSYPQVYAWVRKYQAGKKGLFRMVGDVKACRRVGRARTT